MAFIGMGLANSVLPSPEHFTARTECRHTCVTVAVANNEVTVAEPAWEPADVDGQTRLKQTSDKMDQILAS
jgi:hypothetical protein